MKSLCSDPELSKLLNDKLEASLKSSGTVQSSIRPVKLLKILKSHKNGWLVRNQGIYLLWAFTILSEEEKIIPSMFRVCAFLVSIPGKITSKKWIDKGFLWAHLCQNLCTCYILLSLELFTNCHWFTIDIKHHFSAVVQGNIIQSPNVHTLLTYTATVYRQDRLRKHSMIVILL